jgi:hypothetical protein
MDNLRIILIPVTDKFDGRKHADRIENREVPLKYVEENSYWRSMVFTLSEFMDLCNNQELNLDDWWVTYAKVYDTDLLGVMDWISKEIVDIARKKEEEK